MKFLEVFQLQKLSMALSPPGTSVNTNVELFSCAAGSDKKLYKSLVSLFFFFSFFFFFFFFILHTNPSFSVPDVPG